MALDQSTPFLVPIQPRWNGRCSPMLTLKVVPASEGLAVQPFGNALRKAYSRNSPSRLLRPGDPLLFYRSEDEKAIFVVGVCEYTFASGDAAEIAARVGKRTVYQLEEIEAMTRNGEVLVLMFRQDRILRNDPITLEELLESHLVHSWPQSITKGSIGGTQLVAETSRRVALFSIHPIYAEAILQRTKLVEFRRQRLPAQVTNVVIYATSPVRRIVGAFEVVAVEPTTPRMAWSMYRYVGAIERRQFERYYSGAANAFVIKVGATTRAVVPFPLGWIDPKLRPPQSFLYLRDDQVERTEFTLTSNSGFLSHTDGKRAQAAAAIDYGGCPG